MVSRRDALRTLAVGSSLALAGCTLLDDGPNDDSPEQVGTDWSPSSQEWRFPAADLRNTGHVSLSARERPARGWTDRVTPEREYEPTRRLLAAATEETAIVATNGYGDVALRALAATDGSVRWRRPVEREQEFGQVRFGGLVDGTLYLSVDGRRLLALDATDGSVVWRADLEARLTEHIPDRFLYGETPSDSSGLGLVPMATPETLYVQGSYGLFGIDPADGTTQWRMYLGDERDDRATFRETGAFAIGSDRLWATYDVPHTRLLTVTGDDGTPHVGTLESDDFGGPPVVSGTDPRSYRVALGPWFDSASTFDGPLVWGDVTGTGGWTFPGFAVDGGSAMAGRPVTDGVRVFATQASETSDGVELGVVGLDVETGQVEWLRRVAGEGTAQNRDDRERSIVSDSVVANGTLLVAVGTQSEAEEHPSPGALFGFSTQTGEERWRHELDVAPSHVALAGDRIYVAGTDGGFVALERAG